MLLLCIERYFPLLGCSSSFFCCNLCCWLGGGVGVLVCWYVGAGAGADVVAPVF